jgi:hypothetical protein
MPIYWHTEYNRDQERWHRQEQRLAVGLVIAAAVVLGLLFSCATWAYGPCNPDLDQVCNNPATDPCRTPTPVITWDHDGTNLEGFRLYYRLGPTDPWQEAPGTAGNPLCWRECHEEEPTPGACPPEAWHLHCVADLAGEPPGIGYPVQRAAGPFAQWEAVEVEFMVRAYNQYGESGDSPTITICMPRIMQLR